MEAHSNALNNIAMALRVIRRARGYTQEDFALLCFKSNLHQQSRARHQKSHVGKSGADRHRFERPSLTLLAISFATSPSLDDVSVVLAEVQKEVAALGLP